MILRSVRFINLRLHYDETLIKSFLYELNKVFSYVEKFHLENFSANYTFRASPPHIAT